MRQDQLSKSLIELLSRDPRSEMRETRISGPAPSSEIRAVCLEQRGG